MIRKYIGVVVGVLFVGGCATTPPSPTTTQPDVAVIEKDAAKLEPTEEKAPITSSPASKKNETKEVAAETIPIAKPAPLTPITKPKSEQTTSKKAAKTDVPVAVIIPTDPNTFIINAGIKNKSHPYFGHGDKRGFIVNGEQGKWLVLTRGKTYKFNVDTGMQHDFYFTTSPIGWGGGTVTDGIEGQFTFKGTVIFKPGQITPDVIYYQCRNHKNMGGKIRIINKGEIVKQSDDGVLPGTAAHAATVKVNEREVKQKIAYGDMLITSSPSTKRITEGNDEEAKLLYQQAQTSLADAKKLLNAGENEKAMGAANESLRLMNSAVLMVTDAMHTAGVDAKGEYEKLIEEIKGYEKSYKKNVKKLPKDKLAAKLDEKKFEDLLKRADSSAASEDYTTALKPLREASAMITAAISVMLDDTTVVYDKDFASQEEEYEYELARYNSYVELMPIAIEQRQPNQRQEGLMNQFGEKAKRIVSDGKSLAERGDYTTAIQAMQAATDNVRRALMIIGVR